MPQLSISNQTRREKFATWIVSKIAPNALVGAGFKPAPTVTTVTKPAEENKGFVTQIQDPRLTWLFDKIKVEADRLSTLTDIRIMLDEAPYIDGVCNKFILWAKGGKPRLIFNGGTAKKAERIVNDMLDRIEYMNRRGDYLYNGLFLESFLKKEISFESGVIGGDPLQIYKEAIKGMPLGRIEDILGPLPAETVFRNSNKQDRFDNSAQAFYQVPAPYNNPNIPVESKIDKDWFHQMYILHPRWNHRRQRYHRYSRPALKPVRKAYNRTELSATDAVVQRHLAASRLLVIYLNKNPGQNQDTGISEDELKRFTDDFVRNYPHGFNKAGTVYPTSGQNQVDSVGDLNLTLSKPADIYLQFEFMSVGLMLSPILAGFMGGEGGRVTGPLLEALRTNLSMDIEAVNEWEDQEILLQLCYFELFMNGIFDVEIRIVHDKPAFLKDIEKKVDMSEVAMKAMSLESYFKKNVAPKIDRTWEEEEPVIVEEQKKFGLVGAGFKPAPTENINKGISGSNKDSATIGIKGD